MKKTYLLFLIFLCLNIQGIYSQVSKTIHVTTAGQLSTLLTEAELSNITNLTLTGNINELDFITMKDSMPVLAVIDMADATISTGIIPTNTFYRKLSLTSVTLPASITSYEPAAFYGCTALTSINIPASNLYYTSIDGVVFSDGQTEIIHCPYGRSGSYTIPSSVSTIREKAFSSCSRLTSVIIPISVTVIPKKAFYSCASLTSLTIPDSVTAIHDEAFYSCNHLTSINIPSKVTLIEDSVFRSCRALTSITLPSSVTSIGNYAFNNCTGLTTINIPSLVTQIGNSAFSGCTVLSTISIPSSVTLIGINAFVRCSGLTNFSVSEGNLYYSSLEGVLFNKDKTLLIGYPCNRSGHYNIPSSVTSIGAHAFYECVGLTSITIPSTITTIHDYAFSNCKGLTSLTIPSSVTAINNGVFDACTGLTSINLPNSVTYLGKSAFSNCNKLTSITIPPISHIPESAFLWCKGLTSVSIPSSVTSIGSLAFNECTGLTSLTIASSVTSINYWAFMGCTSLTSIRVYSPLPISFNYSTDFEVFNGVDKTNCKLYVPKNSSSAYAIAYQWEDFSTIEEFDISTGFRGKSSETIRLYPNPVSDNLIIDGAVNSEARIYNVQGNILLTKTIENDHETIDFSPMQPGVYLVKIGDKTVKVMK